MTNSLTKLSLGKLYGIGVGPGDPELITLKGLRLLKGVPVVAFPAGLAGKVGIAERIVQQWLQPDQVHLALNFPYVQDAKTLTAAWQAAAEQVWQHLAQGQDVAFVSEGDVSFYSTFTYLAQTLLQTHPEVEAQTIPGVCSPLAAAAGLGIPLTIWNQRLAILPALHTVSDLETAIATADVVVLLKVSSVYEQVWTILKQQGLLQQSYVVERATLPEQMIYADLSDRPHLKLPYFSLLIVQVYHADLG
ncbi:MAG: precorrin-2 C(20)-methyltransferase [Leptolyngbyaceae cyanobacterium RM1_406_9]|nr:precorrin-2 C(20)-methyltransferase [Leptolyngbyaceae cyanobacterium RM1_406_9]